MFCTAAPDAPFPRLSSLAHSQTAPWSSAAKTLSSSLLVSLRVSGLRKAPALQVVRLVQRTNADELAAGVPLLEALLDSLAAAARLGHLVVVDGDGHDHALLEGADGRAEDGRAAQSAVLRHLGQVLVLEVEACVKKWGGTGQSPAPVRVDRFSFFFGYELSGWGR
jgi:hypothetical protein